MIRVSIHIAYYHYTDDPIKSSERLTYLTRMFEDFFNHWQDVYLDVFIHTNDTFTFQPTIPPFINISHVIYNFKDEDPHNLTWKHRELMETQLDKYDVFIYVEDDIGIPYKAFQYWNKYYKTVEPLYNIGFLRVEKEFCSDMLEPCQPYLMEIDRQLFGWNPQSYSAFWICASENMPIFISSKYWKPHTYFPPDFPPGLSRESAATGPKMMNGRQGALFPIDHDTLSTLQEDCFVFHLPNNYANSTSHLGHFPTKEMVDPNICMIDPKTFWTVLTHFYV